MVVKAELHSIKVNLQRNLAFGPIAICTIVIWPLKIVSFTISSRNFLLKCVEERYTQRFQLLWPLLDLATSSVARSINPIETSTLVYNLYLSFVR